MLVPPLVFEAAFHLNLAELRRSLPTLMLMAIPGVVITMLVVGGIVAWGAALALPVALVFGALIAATDPVAVIALFRAVGAPKQLVVPVEGESLLNDGTAIVIFNLMLAVALTGHFNLMEGLVEFIRVAAGGLGVGLALGWLAAQLIARVDDYAIETALTLVLAFGAYLVAEHFHVSGVLAVVAAGLVSGNLGLRGMSQTTRVGLFHFWEFAAFIANSLVFLLIGLQVNGSQLTVMWPQIAWAIVAVLTARVLVVYGLGRITKRLGEPIPSSWQPVLSWGGLRGAISLALALSLPEALGPARPVLLAMTFGVVLFTLLVQGTTMGALVRGLGLNPRPAHSPSTTPALDTAELAAD